MGRLVPMKHVDSIVEVCNNNNYPLTIIGKGPELAKLQIKAGLTVQFITNASDEEVAKRVEAEAEADKLKKIVEADAAKQQRVKAAEASAGRDVSLTMTVMPFGIQLDFSTT